MNNAEYRAVKVAKGDYRVEFRYGHGEWHIVDKHFKSITKAEEYINDAVNGTKECIKEVKKAPEAVKETAKKERGGFKFKLRDTRCLFIGETNFVNDAHGNLLRCTIVDNQEVFGIIRKVKAVIEVSQNTRITEWIDV